MTATTLKAGQRVRYTGDAARLFGFGFRGLAPMATVEAVRADGRVVVRFDYRRDRKVVPAAELAAA
jgi:hypothetical protein